MEEDLKGFKVLFAAVQVVGVLCVVLVAIWTGSYGGGFAWRSNPKLEFNWHPLLMTFGFIYLYGSSILVYRALRNLRKQKLKIIHACIHTAVVFCVLFAQIAVFDSHNLAKPKPIPNLYSLHSWIGLITVICFVLQWAGSIFVFLYPGAPLHVRGTIMPYHVFGGLLLFCMVVGTAISGLTEKALFTLQDSYSDFNGHGLLINFIGLSFIVFAALVVYTATHPKYKRYPRPEDGALLSSSPVDAYVPNFSSIG